MAATRYTYGKTYANGATQVLLTISHHQKRKRLSINIAVKPSEIVAQAKGVKLKPKVLVARLEEIESKVKEIFREYQFDNQDPTLDQVIEKFEAWFRPYRVRTITPGDWEQAFKGWLEYMEKKKKLDPGTIKAKKVLGTVIELSRAPGTKFTEDWLDGFLDYMLDVHPVKGRDGKTRKGYTGEVAEKKLDHLKEFIRHANKEGYNLDPAVLEWKPKREIKKGKMRPIFVNDQEFRVIVDTDLSKLDFIKDITNFSSKKAEGETQEEFLHRWAMIQKYMSLKRVRDIAIKLYTTGFHYKDSDIKPQDVLDGDIEKYRKKTDKRVTIPVVPELQEVLDNNAGHTPFLSNKNTNDGLKSLFRELGLKRMVKVEIGAGEKRQTDILPLCDVVSTKMFRNGFLTRLAKAGIHNAGIAAAGGHTDLNTQNIYINTEEFRDQVKKAISGK